MEIQQYISRKKELYENILSYLENEDENNLRSQSSLISNFNILSHEENQEEFIIFLRLIIQIARNHHRSPNFNLKIDQILKFFQNKIKQTLSNNEIFDLFKNHKRLLLYLLQNDFITVDQAIFECLSKNVVYRHFFAPEIKSFTSKSVKRDDLFEQKRQIGENESYLCQLIREDSVEEFVTFVNRTNLNISTKIKRSIFETNYFLIMNEPTLIEYAAFFGSFQIFKYLQLNNVELSPSLWFYVIHGKNAELIHLLEELNVLPDDESYESCLIESIKCHHNDIANYIFDNLFTKAKSNFDEDVLDCIFGCYNYFFFPEKVDDDDSFYYMCQYNYLNLVNTLIDVKKKELESIIISFLFYNL